MVTRLSVAFFLFCIGSSIKPNIVESDAEKVVVAVLSSSTLAMEGPIIQDINALLQKCTTVGRSFIPL